jgi:hypothetical protein
MSELELTVIDCCEYPVAVIDVARNDKRQGFETEKFEVPSACFVENIKLLVPFTSTANPQLIGPMIWELVTLLPI